MSNLSVTYLRLDLELQRVELEEAETYLRTVAHRYASVVYRQNVEVHIEVQQGSVRVWIAVAGSIYLAIGQYGSFRAGVDQIIKDSKAVKEYVVGTLVKDGVSENLILEARRVRCVPDKIRYLLLRIDRFEKSLPTLDREEAEREERRIMNAVHLVADKLTYKEDLDAFIGCLDERYRPSPERLGSRYKQPLRIEDDYRIRLAAPSQTNTLVLGPRKHNFNLDANNASQGTTAPLTLRGLT